MQVDLNTVPPAPPSALPVTDICIIGAGIAGLLLALRLADAGKTVALLEAGGMQLEAESQSLFEAEMGGELHRGSHQGRFRTFGGSSIRWGGQLLPYPPEIFHPAAGTPSAPWPIATAEIEPYYEPLQELLQTDLLPFDVSLLGALKRPSLNVGTDLVLRFSKWIPFQYRNLGETVGKRVLAHRNVTVYSHANVVELHAEEGRVTHARVKNYAGVDFVFQAGTFLLCAGTVESSRLLLCSPTIPDPHGQIGRGFHDHLSVRVGSYSGTGRKAMLRALGPFFHGGTLHTFKLEASAALRQREALLNVMAHVTVTEPEGSGTAAVRAALSSFQKSGVAGLRQLNLKQMSQGALTALKLLLWARLAGRRAVSPEAAIDLRIDVEQPARDTCRIALSDRLDSIGMRKAIVHWSVGNEERRTVQSFAVPLREHLERLGLEPQSWIDLHGEKFSLADTYHPMGGLHMGPDPETSVVNTDLRLHTITNLYVAGCSVFPSGGSSNPTFTAMALALRLADHLTRSR